MFKGNDRLAEEYLAECGERMAAAAADLLAIEKGGARINEELVNRVLSSVHAVRAGAGFFDLMKLGGLARQTEDVIVLIRSGELVPISDCITILLIAIHRLHELIRSSATSEEADIAEVVAALARLLPPQQTVPGGRSSPSAPARQLRVLLAEDDYASRLLLQTFLSRFGECKAAVNGREAVQSARSALERGQGYDLICMDIMMPEMDGRDAVREIRQMEEAHGVTSTHGAKIIMTTAIGDIKVVSRCFWELCDAYLVKPIDLAELLGKMTSWQLVSQPALHATGLTPSPGQTRPVLFAGDSRPA